MTRLEQDFEASSSSIALVGSILAGVYMLVGPIAAASVNRSHHGIRINEEDHAFWAVVSRVSDRIGSAFFEPEEPDLNLHFFVPGSGLAFFPNPTFFFTFSHKKTQIFGKIKSRI